MTATRHSNLTCRSVTSYRWAKRIARRVARKVKKADLRKRLAPNPIRAAAGKMVIDGTDTHPVLRGATSRAEFDKIPRTVFSLELLRMVPVWRGYAVHQGAKECAKRRWRAF